MSVSTDATRIDGSVIAGVRRFSRTVTQRLGVLHDRYLAARHSLGESRVLWEIGPDGAEVRVLRARLDLDSGYLSRLLRSLEADGLVTVRPSDGDRRVHTARLTKAGLAERAVLDRRSDELARSMLAVLSPAQRERLTAAMADVERLLTSSLAGFHVVDPGTPAAAPCMQAYFAEIGTRFDGGFDAALSTLPDHAALRPPRGLFVLAMLHGEPIGCGALVFHHGDEHSGGGDEPVDLKRMWVSPEARGLGVGRRLLTRLEELAAEHGVTTVRLETNRALPEAIALYRSAGYAEVEPFNDERYAHHWFVKHLG